MENLEVLINIGATSSNHETQINVMRVLSTVGCVLSNKLPLHPLLTVTISRYARVGPKLGQTGPKWDKSGTF